MISHILSSGKQRLWDICRDQLILQHKLKYIFWECTLNCNFYCDHCGSSAGRNFYDNEISTEVIKSTFKRIARELDPKEITIAVTGGEPLLRPDLCEVMGYAHSLGFNWGIVTNGFLVNDKKVEELKSAGLSTAVVSIDGYKETHDKFRNRTGAYANAINALELLKKANFLKELQVTTVVHKDNLKELNALYAVFSNLKIDSWRIVNVDPIGRGGLTEHLLLDENEFRQMLDFIKEKRQNGKLLVEYSCSGYLGSEYELKVRDTYFYCATGRNIASILHNGDIYVCPNVPRIPELVQGNILKDDFLEVWNNKFEAFRPKGRTKNEKCSKCYHWEDCLGGPLHLWDFAKKQPKMCHVELLNKSKK